MVSVAKKHVKTKEKNRKTDFFKTNLEVYLGEVILILTLHHSELSRGVHVKTC